MTTTSAWLAETYGHLDHDLRAYTWEMPGKTTLWFGPSDLDQVAETIAASTGTHDLYSGVSVVTADDAARAGSRRRPRQSPTPEDPDSAVVAGVVALVADIDLAGPGHQSPKPYPPTMPDALAVIERVPLQPTALVHSGHGLHVWWHLKEPWVFDSDEERKLAIALFRGWSACVRSCAQALEYDIDSVPDLSRVLRIPGTLNHKNGTSAPVEIIRIDWDLRYEPSHFDDWRAEITEDPTPAAQAMPAAFPWSKHEVLCENLEGYRATWDHRRPDLAGKSCSEYDMALAHYGVMAGWSDAEISALLIAHRARFQGAQDKSKRVDYLSRTIAKARTSSGVPSPGTDALTILRSDESDRPSKVRALATLLDIPLDDIRHIEGPSGVYEFYLLGKCVEIPATRLRDQAYFAGQIFDLTNRAPVTWPTRPSKDHPGGLTWREVMHAIAAAAESVASNDDVSVRGGTLSILRDYCQDNQLTEYPPGTTAPPHQPFIREGRIWLHLDSFRRYATTRDFPLERSALIQRLHGWGAVRTVISVKATPERNTTRYMYGIPVSVLRSEDSE